MTTRVSCSSGPACPDTGRVRAVFARTDLRPRARHRLQPACHCLRRGGVYSARRRKAPSIRFVGLRRLSLRQGTTLVHPEARRAVPKSHAKLWALAPEAGSIFMHPEIKMYPSALMLRRTVSAFVGPDRIHRAAHRNVSTRETMLPTMTRRQGTACLRRQARRRFAVACAFVGAGLIPARRRKAPSIRFVGPPRLSLRQGTASAVPKVQHLQGASAPEGRFMHRGIKMHPLAAILRHAASVPEKRKLRPTFPVTRNGIA